MKPLDPEFVPHTFDGAIAELIRLLEPKDIEAIKRIRPGEVHFSMGMFLRNNWNMWDTKSMLNQDFQKRYGLFGHGDDVSGLLLHCLWCDVRGQPREDEKMAERYRKHWRGMGVNPATGEDIPGGKRAMGHAIVISSEDIE